MSLALGACVGGGEALPDDVGGGNLTASWEDGDTISIAIDAPARARWCAEGRWLELSAVIGDTGVMVAVFPADSLVAGTYLVVRPVRSDSLRPRPSATLGVRWFTPGLVAGFRGWEGEVTLADPVVRDGQGVSGRFQASAASVAGEAGAIAVEGEFEDVPVTPADSACASLS